MKFNLIKFKNNIKTVLPIFLFVLIFLVFIDLYILPRLQVNFFYKNPDANIVGISNASVATSGSEPIYNPSLLSDGVLSISGCSPGESLQCTNNCYSYAANNLTSSSKRNMCKPQPGASQGNAVTNISCDEIKKRAIDEGFKEWDRDRACEYGYSKVALVVDIDGTQYEQDYHWYRQDKGGFWSSKPGWDVPTNLDSSDNKIYDPFIADRDLKDGVINYEDFCNYFCVPVVGIDLQCIP